MATPAEIKNDCPELAEIARLAAQATAPSAASPVAATTDTESTPSPGRSEMPFSDPPAPWVEPSQSWAQTERTLTAPLPVPRDAVRAPAPDRLRISLMPHQETTLAAMLDLEANREIALEYFPNTATSPTGSWMLTSGGRLSEPFGSGKTIIVAGLICARTVPAARPTIVRPPVTNKAQTRSYYPGGAVRGTGVFRYAHSDRKVQPIIERLMPRVLPTNVILVSTSAYNQFIREFKDHTDLRVASIRFVNELRKFETDLAAYKKTLGDCSGAARPPTGDFPPDVLIVRAGLSVTKNFHTAWEARFGRDNMDRPLVSGLAAVLAGWTVARFIVDDFDMLDVSRRWIAPDAYFTWYVSATSKQRPGTRRANPGSETADSPHAALEVSRARLSDASRDHVFQLGASIASESEYYEASVRLPQVVFYRYDLVNPIRRAVNLIGALGNVDDNVMEILNGDAVGAAGEAALGYRVDSVGALLEDLLRGQADVYRKALRAGGRIPQVRRAAAKAKRAGRPQQEHRAIPLEWLDEHADPEFVDELETGDTPTISIFRIVRDGGDPMFGRFLPLVNAPSPALNIPLGEVRAWADKAREDVGRDLERVRANVREGECPACLLPLAEIDALILKCCGTVLCVGCAAPNAAHAHGRDRIVRSCPNCQTPTHTAGFIVIRSDVPIEDLLDDRALVRAAVAPEPEPEPETLVATTAADEAAPEVDPYAKIENPKLRVLARIIDGANFPAALGGDQSEAGVEINHAIPKLCAGRERVDGPPDAERRVLVFTKEKETIAAIARLLDTRKDPYKILRGNARRISEIARAFQRGEPLEDEKIAPRVLVIEAERYCASLNLQAATDLVMYHKITDPAIEAQLGGRIQRIGREHSARIHYLLYENENIAGIVRAA